MLSVLEARVNVCVEGELEQCADLNAHGNDSGFHRAVEPDSLLSILWHFSCFAD